MFHGHLTTVYIVTC